MASTCTIPLALDTITAGLKLRTGLIGVKVFSGPVTQDDAGLECIAFGDVHGTEDPEAMVGEREEDYVIEGTLLAVKSGAGETVIKAARDRAFAIYAEIEAYLNDDNTLGGRVLDAEPARVPDVEQVIQPEGRECYLDFGIRVRAIKNP